MRRAIVIAAMLAAACEEQRPQPTQATQQNTALNAGGDNGNQPPVVLNLGGQGAADTSAPAVTSTPVTPAQPPPRQFAVVVRDADAGVDPVEADYPPLNVSAVDPGRGWQCSGGACYRSQERCEAFRARMRDTGPPTPACAPSARAWCITSTRTTARGSVYDSALCFPESAGIAACRESREYTQRRNRIRVDDRNISRCELVE
jgi:hypothetical protein